jgi:GTPase
MKEFVISEAQTEKAVLVGLITQTQNERKTNEYLDELAFLAETAGAEVVKRFTQKLDTPNSVTYVGKGKLQEVKEYLELQNESEETEIGMVIFDDELSAKQIRNIENELKVKILDRTSLILDIFFRLRSQVILGLFYIRIGIYLIKYNHTRLSTCTQIGNCFLYHLNLFLKIRM